MRYEVKCPEHGKHEVRASMEAARTDSLLCPVCGGPAAVVPCARRVFIPMTFTRVEPIRERDLLDDPA